MESGVFEQELLEDRKQNTEVMLEIKRRWGHRYRRFKLLLWFCSKDDISGWLGISSGSLDTRSFCSMYKAKKASGKTSFPRQKGVVFGKIEVSADASNFTSKTVEKENTKFKIWLIPGKKQFLPLGTSTSVPEGVHRSWRCCNTRSMRGVDGASSYSNSLLQKSI